MKFKTKFKTFRAIGWVLLKLRLINEIQLFLAEMDFLIEEGIKDQDYEDEETKMTPYCIPKEIRIIFR